ncbi:helix-turn-helix transcriptional regulator [Massilia forsythiae]|uniref:Helix-turn-helix transcriptional regulator n=1 Tax=Massilia forsythiae TaxID=2728020 RepID=A0A7Z2VT02_9BURK|nr:S24 family peptidase [Massilia forsythiae]QJD98633.1 helix-turn-helix transcriptional regulator [Massilia forsythiae]
MKFAQILRKRRKELGLTQQNIADIWGIKSVNVSDWERGKGMPEASKLPALAKRLEMSLSELMGETARLEAGAQVALMQDDLEDGPEILATPRLIPVAGRVQAGPDGLLHIDDFPLECPEGYMLWYTSCVEAYALRVRGESMSPRYLPGEYVGVDPCADVLPSDEVIVLFHEGQRMIKRLLWARDGQACFESVNKDYQNIICDLAEISAMHLVIGHIPKSAFRPSV